MEISPLKIKKLPDVPKLTKLFGPSFIILGLGLGSGELILWPYLASNYGLGIMWGALIGITIQFFLNMEISRYTLLNGESIFIGFARRFGILAPNWFIASTLIPWMWPGIIATSGSLLAKSFNFSNPTLLTILLLFLIGIIYTLGSVIYKTQEKLNRLIILFGIPFILFLALIFCDFSDLGKLTLGLVGKGEGYWFLPAGITLSTFLAALAYSGAGGNLNLAQSFYVKDKGYGMGKYADKIKGLFFKSGDSDLAGSTFSDDTANRSKFKLWWKNINTEHLLIFWLLGFFTMMLLSLLAYATTRGESDLSGINFIFAESNAISSGFVNIVGVLFIVVAAIMLFGTQFSVYGSTSRIISENISILTGGTSNKSSKYFFLFLWLQIILACSVLLLGFTEPLTLVVIGAVLNAFTMFVYSVMLLIMNSTIISRPYRPNLFRKLTLLFAIIFYGGFSLFTILQAF
jgi:hypothetical protein